MGDSGQKLTGTNQGKLTIEDINGRLLVRDANNLVKMLAGYDDSGDIVVKIAKNGFDATTTSASNLIFNSSQNVFKIVAEGNITGSFPNTHTTDALTIPHNLGFIPIPWVFFGNTGAGVYVPLPYFGSFGTGGTNLTPDGYFFPSVDTKNLYISCIKASFTASNVPFTYYLLQETAN